MLKWGGITFGIGIALVIIEIYFAGKKKEGILPEDKKRIWGIVWLAFIAPVVVMAFIWMA